MGTVSHSGRRAQDPMPLTRLFSRQAKSALPRLGLLGALALLPAASVAVAPSAAVVAAPRTSIASVGPSSPCDAVPLPC